MLSSFEQFTSKNAKILWGVLAVILIALPFVVKNQYFLTVVAKIGCYAILGLGLNILTGYTGLVSLGHAGFVAIGAYTASLLAVTLGWSFFPAMLAGMLLFRWGPQALAEGLARWVKRRRLRDGG